jgi:hypothetical protein
MTEMIVGLALLGVSTLAVAAFRYPVSYARNWVRILKWGSYAWAGSIGIFGSLMWVDLGLAAHIAESVPTAPIGDYANEITSAMQSFQRAGLSSLAFIAFALYVIILWAAPHYLRELEATQGNGETVTSAAQSG